MYDDTTVKRTPHSKGGDGYDDGDVDVLTVAGGGLGVKGDQAHVLSPNDQFIMIIMPKL